MRHDVRMSDDTWTERDDVHRHFDALPEGHPARVVRAFQVLAMVDDYSIEELTQLVTPESRGCWGDFSTEHQYFADQAFAISVGAYRHVGAEDVAYVTLSPDTGEYYQEGGLTGEVAHVTLVWRPELGGWRIDQLGYPAPPPYVPRTSKPSDAPRYDTDAMVEIVADD